MKSKRLLQLLRVAPHLTSSTSLPWRFMAFFLGNTLCVCAFMNSNPQCPRISLSTMRRIYALKIINISGVVTKERKKKAFRRTSVSNNQHNDPHCDCFWMVFSISTVTHLKINVTINLYDTHISQAFLRFCFVSSRPKCYCLERKAFVCFVWHILITASLCRPFGLLS